MGQMMRCPLVGTPCYRPIVVQENSFFLAEPEQPLEDRTRRMTAIEVALGDEYSVVSALNEKGINAFTCKICEMIQASAYCIADIKGRNANVLFELGMMVALGKPTIILAKKDEDMGLSLPSDLNAIEVFPFTEYIDVVKQIKDFLPKLPPALQPSSVIDELAGIRPQFAEELRKVRDDIVREFNENIAEAKLDKVSATDERKEVPPELSERLRSLEEKLEEMSRLGLVTDAGTAFLRGNHFLSRGEYSEALGTYNWSLEMRPDDTDTLNNRGVTYDRMERYDEALSDFNRSLELRPEQPGTLTNRGNTYYRLGRYQDALADHNRSLKLRPDDAGTLMNRGVAYGHMGKYEEALADFNRSLELRPDYPRAMYDLACLFSLWEKKDDALAYLEKAINGYENYREMVRTDSDFDNIRDYPRFKKLVEGE